MPVLTAIDILGIQSYIFASNRLRDVVGASYHVEWATSQEGGLCFDNDSIPKPEIIVAAGGNAILRFDTLDFAKQYILHYTRRLIEQAPGLDVAVAHEHCDDGKLAHGLLALQVQLAKAKLSRRPHVPQLGLSVMQPCAVTGLPAAMLSTTDSKWVSSSISQLRGPKTLQVAKERWEEFLRPCESLNPALCDYNLGFPNELDQMGRTHGDTSLIGVVHVDGNGIGKRIQKWLVGKLESASITDEVLIDEYQKWSNALNSLGKAVLQSIANRLVSRIELLDERIYVRGQPRPPKQLDFELRVDSDNTILLPLRPILLGGDDLTFVCDGRIAIDLATSALRAFVTESANIHDLRLLGDDPVTACAGVALVKAHAPFNRSYQLCEDLCKSAKLAKREADSGSLTSNSGCWIDWHIGTIRPDESVVDIRKRQYQGDTLTCRPYPLDGDSSQQLTWEWLDDELLGEPVSENDQCPSFRNSNVWGERRNKVKALASLVVDGDKVIKKQIEAWNSVAPELRLPSPINENGFKGNRTPLLDAVELLDIHMHLETQKSLPPSGRENAEVNE